MTDIANEDLTKDMIKSFHKILKMGTTDSRKELFNVREYKRLHKFSGRYETKVPKDVAKNIKKLFEMNI